jgi:hypothetical protein
VFTYCRIPLSTGAVKSSMNDVLRTIYKNMAGSSLYISSKVHFLPASLQPIMWLELPNLPKLTFQAQFFGSSLSYTNV